MADENLLAQVRQLNQHPRYRGAGPREALPIDGDGGGPHDFGMLERVAKLEAEARVANDRFGRIEGKLDALPTKTDMLTMFIATFAALGLIFAGVAWLDGRANRYSQASQVERPIVIQMPDTASSAPPAKVTTVIPKK